MRIRSIFVIFLCLCLAGVLCGCNEPDPVSTTMSVGMCLKGKPLPIHTAAKDALTEQIGPTSLSDANGDAALQLRQAEVYLQEGYGLLVVEPVDESTAQTLVALSDQYQTPILFIEFSDNQNIIQQTNLNSHIGYSPYMARVELKKLMDLLPSGGDTNLDGEVSCLLITDSSQDPFREAVVQHFMDGTDENLLLQVITCDGTTLSAREVCDQTLAAYGRDIEVVITTTADIAAGALEAIRGRGWYPGTDNYVLAVDLEDCSWLLEEGASGVVFPDAEGYAALVASVADELLLLTPRQYGILAPWLAKR